MNTDTWVENSNDNVSGGKHIEVGSVSEFDLLDKMNKKVMALEAKYAAICSENLALSDSLMNQTDYMHMTNMLFNKEIAELTLPLLRKGVSPKSLIRATGLWMASCYYNKMFRANVNQVLVNTFYPLMKNKAKKSKERSLCRVRSGHQPDEMYFTPDVMALCMIGMARQAYDIMHTVGTDADMIMMQYNARLEELYKLAMADGIRKETVDRRMRKIVGDLIEYDRKYLAVFKETAYDTVVRGDDVAHIQRFGEDEAVQERTYTSWEGTYLDEYHNEFTSAFTPRVPETVNELRKRSCEAWYDIMFPAETPEAWGAMVTSDYARHIQRRYLYFISIDNFVDDVSDLNSLMDNDDDVSWLFDIDGDDPFTVGSIDDNFAELMQRGPKPDSNEIILGNYPEFKSAYCKWLNNHPDMSPMAQQAKANATYYEYAARGMKDDELVNQIFAYMQKRDELQRRWDAVMEKVNDATAEPAETPVGRKLPGES